MKRGIVQAKEYVLPEEAMPGKTKLGDFSMLLHGEKKIGKTALASRFPGAFFFKFEPGEGDRALHGVDILDWTDFRGYSRAFTKSTKFKTAIIDTVKVAYDLCLKYVCTKMGVDHPSDEGYGKGWDAVKKEFTDTMMPLHRGSRGPIYIGHSEEKEIKRLDGTSNHKIVPGVSKAVRDFVDATVDIIAYATYDAKGRRVLQLTGSDHVVAGHRCREHFVGVSQISMGRNEDEAYQNFVKAFNISGGDRDVQVVDESRGDDEPVARRVIRRVRK